MAYKVTRLILSSSSNQYDLEGKLNELEEEGQRLVQVINPLENQLWIITKEFVNIQA